MRRSFDNYAEFEALYPGAEELYQHVLDMARIVAPRQMPRALRERLEARADLLVGATAKVA